MTSVGRVACCIGALTFSCLFCLIHSQKERFAADIQVIVEFAKRAREAKNVQSRFE
jgi:hypothetical protein